MGSAIVTRRSLLATLSGGVAVGLAGCAGDADGDGDTPTATDTEFGSPTAATDTQSPTTATDTQDPSTEATGLDLREANVVDVAFERDGSDYTFDVTLHHDDDGEEGYANWWQIERLDGTRLGRRELLHAHSEQPFTRSDTVAIPEEVTCVVVRGHDQTHGYGGRLVVAGLDSGATTSVDQGPDRQSADASDCPPA